jgi:lysozyme
MSAQNEALEVAESLCKQFEGFSAVPYICPAGYATQGFGTVWKPDGTKVTMNDPPISVETALEWLDETLQGYAMGVLKVSPNLLKYPQKLGAITDFAYNLGVARYRASTLRSRINEENWPEAVTELHKWCRGGGKILQGLVRRRAAEAKIVGKCYYAEK